MCNFFLHNAGMLLVELVKKRVPVVAEIRIEMRNTDRPKITHRLAARVATNTAPMSVFCMSELFACLSRGWMHRRCLVVHFVGYRSVGHMSTNSILFSSYIFFIRTSQIFSDMFRMFHGIPSPSAGCMARFLPLVKTRKR